MTMPIYNYEKNELTRLDITTFSNEGILERRHLQATLKEQIEVIVPDSLVISEEFSEWSGSKRRIDLLAVDKDANLVVIELKRDETGEHMDLQSLRYAAMVSTLTFRRAVEIFQKYLRVSSPDEDAQTLLLSFLGWDEPQEDDFAVDVRIILVSADFSRELTTSVMWLNERNLDIRCVRLIPYNFEGKVLIDVQQVIPLPEAESYQIRIRQKSEERREAKRSQRDYTKYRFNGDVYNKRKLVLAVVQEWISKNKPGTMSELLLAFPQELRPGGIFVPLAEAEAKYKRQGRRRHFLEDDEIIRFPDSTQYAISNQWSKEWIDDFISQAGELGFEIEEI
jgi:hypothetical protein